MEARFFPAAALLAVVVSLGAGYRSANFVVEAPTPDLAEKIGKAAERYRRDLATDWLGAPMPNWSRPCPIQAEVAPHLGAGGATSFVFDRGEVFSWDMKIQGSEQRILDSVLPHEVTHTIFASYFRRPLPRWADEGACTTVEHTSERNKQQHMLINFLRTGHGIAFHQMFAMKEYPPDVLPLYSQGYSLARFLIEQGGRQKFLAFVGDGMKSENWSATINSHYGFANLKVLQDQWLEWVKQGSPTLNSEQSATLLAAADRQRDAQSNPTYRAQSGDRNSAPAGKLVSWSQTGGDNFASATRPNSRIEDQGRAANGNDAWIASEARAAGNDASLSAGKKSVYDRRPAAESPATASVETPRREPEYVARRDAALPGAPQRQVLLEWTRPQ